MTYAGLIELLERLRSDALVEGRRRDSLEIAEAIEFVMDEGMQFFACDNCLAETQGTVRGGPIEQCGRCGWSPSASLDGA